MEELFEALKGLERTDELTRRRLRMEEGRGEERKEVE